MVTKSNKFLGHGDSDESDQDNGYDSEAAEVIKGSKHSISRPRVKRRKLSQSGSASEEDFDHSFVTARGTISDGSEGDQDEHLAARDQETQGSDHEQESQSAASLTTRMDEEALGMKIQPASSSATLDKASKKGRKADKKTTPGVIYLSSLPPYLKPSALRNMLQQRGFGPVGRLFLAPASKAKSSSKKNSRQLYAEGWVEFLSKKTARRCAEALNANIIGGKKGGFYHDDLWNMKYLKGMGWDELMAGVREERREEEGRRDEERRIIAKETERFLDGVEAGKKLEGMKRKRKGKEKSNEGSATDPEIKRTWRQFQVQGTTRTQASSTEKVNEDVQAVLGKIF